MATEPVSAWIAKQLAAKVISAAIPVLKTRLIGKDEERAIASAFRSAFAKAVDELDEERLAELEPLLVDFFGDAEVSGALVEVALARRPPDTEHIRNRLWAVGFDPSTFPIDVEPLVKAVARHLTDELRRHAARKDSAVFNEVALAELAGLHRRLDEVAGAAGPAPAIGTAPPLPGLVLGRDAAVRELKSRLGIAAHGDPTNATQVITAVRGWPGVGKTTLAAVLAHDAEVLAAFPDGLLWATLNRRERVASELLTWGRAIGLGSEVALADPGELSGRLRAALIDKRMLLVLDDVWDAADAAPFRVGGRHCAYIVTTRLRDVAAALAPTPDGVYRLDVLDDDSAIALLERLAPAVVSEHPAEAAALVRELEGLPLALQVAGHLLHAEAELGVGVEPLLADLREGAAVLAAEAPADRRVVADETTATVAALLDQSTDRLTADERERFTLLGAFAPRPATFSVDALAAVWAVDDPVPTIRTLVRRGLLEPIGDRRFQMHALLVMHANSLPQHA